MIKELSELRAPFFMQKLFFPLSINPFRDIEESFSMLGAEAVVMNAEPVVMSALGGSCAVLILKFHNSIKHNRNYFN